MLRERGKAYKLRNFSTKGIKQCGTVSIRWPVKASESLAGQMEGSSLPKALSSLEVTAPSNVKTATQDFKEREN